MIDIYTDGSFANGNYAWAFVAYKKGLEFYRDFGLGKNEEAKSSSFINFTNEMIVGGKTYSGDTNWDIGGVLLKPFFFKIK